MSKVGFDEAKRNVKAQGRLYVALNIMTQVISWSSTFILIRILSPEDYGLMTMASIFTGFILIFSNFGLGNSIVRSKDISQEELSTIFWFSLIIGVTFGLITLLLAEFTAYVFDNQEVAPITRTIAILFIIASTSIVPLNLLSRSVLISNISFISFASVAVSCITGLTMALNGFGVYSLIFSTVSLEFCKSILSFLISGWRPNKHFNLPLLRQHLYYGVNLSLSNLVKQLTESSVNFIFAKQFDLRTLGNFTIGSHIPSLPVDKISALLNPVIFPLLSRSNQNKDYLESTYRSYFLLSSLILVPVYLGLFYASNELSHLLFGEKWSDLGYFLRCFCVYYIFRFLFTSHSNLLSSLGFSKTIRNFQLVFFIITNALVIPTSFVSIKSAALSYVIGYITLVSLWIIKTTKLTNFSLLSHVRLYVNFFIIVIAIAIPTQVLCTIVNYYTLSDISFVLAVAISIFISTAVVFLVGFKPEAKKLFYIIRGH
jgi:O-antigen/teichoic acid export membrane protein